MSRISFSPAVRANVPLLIGMVGGTGSGKTVSAFELATGLSGGKPFAVIDTESGRAKHYAADAESPAVMSRIERSLLPFTYRFDHADLRAPFRPDAYTDALITAEEAGYTVAVVDSMSHVWAGDGGVLDWQEEELDRMAGQDYGKREACKMAAWVKPKVAHKRMMQRLLQMRMHLILCFRAEQKIEMIKEEGKWKIVPKVSLTGLEGWIPVCEKTLPYELTASFLLTADAPGIVKPIKLQQQHRPFFPLDQPVTREAGRLLAEWSKGGPTAAVLPPPRPFDELAAAGEAIAATGTAALAQWWEGALTKSERILLKGKIAGWKQLAESAAA